jgi:uncharacterized protein YdhG (YjbR/CyaY superfamily)
MFRDDTVGDPRRPSSNRLAFTATLGPPMSPKMKKAVSVDAYLADLPEEARATLEPIRRAIRAAAPKATETIAYGMPAFDYAGHPLVYFAAFKKHCSFFPASYAVMETFAGEMKRYDVEKGTIRFPIGKPLPATLVKKIVNARIRENDARRR